jgi:hypothetical protein
MPVQGRSLVRRDDVLDGAEAPLGRLDAGLDDGEAAGGAGQGVPSPAWSTKGRAVGVMFMQHMLEACGGRRIRGGTEARH